jgi:hypothetical protein
MSYPTAAELVNESSVAALTTLDSGDQEVLRQISIAAIETYCGQSFELLTDHTEVIDGTGGRVLYLPRRLLSVTEFIAEDSALEIDDIRITEDGARIQVNAELYTGNYYTRTLRELNDNQPMWFTYGTGTVTITGDWGWDNCPVAVRRALLRDMEDTALADSNALNESLRAYRKLGLSDVSQGNLRATMTATPTIAEDVAALLQPYIWMGEIGAVV